MGGVASLPSPPTSPITINMEGDQNIMGVKDKEPQLKKSEEREGQKAEMAKPVIQEPNAVVEQAEAAKPEETAELKEGEVKPETKVKAEETVAKTEQTWVETEDTEVNTEDAEVKTEEVELKMEETEVTNEKTEVTTEVGIKEMEVNTAETELAKAGDRDEEVEDAGVTPEAELELEESEVKMDDIESLKIVHCEVVQTEDAVMEDFHIEEVVQQYDEAVEHPPDVVVRASQEQISANEPEEMAESGPDQNSAPDEGDWVDGCMKQIQNAKQIVSEAEELMEKNMKVYSETNQKPAKSIMRLPKAILNRMADLSGGVKTTVNNMQEKYMRKLIGLTEQPQDKEVPLDFDDLKGVKEDVAAKIAELEQEVIDILKIYQEVLNEEHMKNTRLLEDLEEAKDTADIQNHQLRSELAEIMWENSRIKSDKDEINWELEKLKQQYQVETMTISTQSSVEQIDAETNVQSIDQADAETQSVSSVDQDVQTQHVESGAELKITQSTEIDAHGVQSTESSQSGIEQVDAGTQSAETAVEQTNAQTQDAIPNESTDQSSQSCVAQTDAQTQESTKSTDQSSQSTIDQADAQTQDVLAAESVDQYSQSAVIGHTDAGTQNAMGGVDKADAQTQDISPASQPVDHGDVPQ